MVALDQVERQVDDRSYDEWSRAALIVANARTIATGGKKEYKVSDIIRTPAEMRAEAKEKQRKAAMSHDELRQIAIDKGLNPSF